MRYCLQKGHKAGKNLKFLCKMGQSIQTFSAEIMCKINQDESLLFFFSNQT